MGHPSRAKTEGTALSHLDIATLEAPIAVCSAAGLLHAASSSARRLLTRASPGEQPPLAVPAELWSLLERTPNGQAVEWRSPVAAHEVLGCTRYPDAAGAYVLLMGDVSSKRLALSELLHRQRLDMTEHLVAGIAQDIRSPVASMVYSAEFLNARLHSAEPQVIAEALGDISRASTSLQQTLDSLLDYAHLGPAVCAPVQLRSVLNRAMASVRSQHGAHTHRLRVDVAPRAETVRGNSIIVEQIFVGLLRNAVEAAAAPGCVIVTAFPALPSHPQLAGAPLRVCVRVWDDGPGIPREYRNFVFDPFFTTKPGSLGLGLAIARRDAESLDGVLELTDDDTGTCFSLYLPGVEEVT